MTSQYDLVDWFGKHYGIEFKHKSGDEYASVNGCPWCGRGDKRVSNRFHVWRESQNYWCRNCRRKGFLDEVTGEKEELKRLDDVERRLREVEIEQQRAKREQERLDRKQREHEERLRKIEQIHACKDHLLYHKQVSQSDALDYWVAEGMTMDTIARYKLGYCQRCPTDYKGRASYTIPVISNGQLWNIRHRLRGADDGDKYRPHMAGLPNVLFNADYLRGGSDDIMVVEGEKKSIVVAQVGFPNVGVMGKSGFDRAWVPMFDRFQRVYVALDPDAIEQAVDIASLFDGRGRVVSLPGKVDDLITRHGATVQDIYNFLQVARPAGGERVH